VRQTNPDGTSTLLLFDGLYEVSLDAGGQQTGAKRYYAIGGSPIALRDESGMFYLLTDRQGSVVAVLDGAGAAVAEQRYREASRSGAEGPALRAASPRGRHFAHGPGVHGAEEPRGRRAAGLSRSTP
jgi:hypothetical protein